MSVFKKNYSKFYDSFYNSKDYAVECDFIQQLFNKYATNDIKKILDLGAGTGGHSLLLAERGYDVVGVDQSAAMLEKAQKKASNSETVSFIQGDIRNLKLGTKFDAVIAMFAVMGYQTSNDDLEDAITTARQHLTDEGLFVFDVWFGPAVLTDRPVDRVKTISLEDGQRILRIATPVVNINDHTVEVNYELLHISGKTILSETSESHLMRFFFPQEIAYFLSRNGFSLIHLSPFMSLDNDVTENDWNVTIVARAV